LLGWLSHKSGHNNTTIPQNCKAFLTEIEILHIFNFVTIVFAKCTKIMCVKSVLQYNMTGHKTC